MWYAVIGYTLNESEPVPADYQKNALAQISSNELVCNYGAYTYEIVAQQRIISDKNSWWKPEDRTNDEFIIAIPSGKFDFLQLQVSYLSTRYIADVDSIKWSADKTGIWNAEFTFKKDIDTSQTWLTHIGYIEDHWRTKYGANWYKTSLNLNAEKNKKE